jgi:hypothetical protein
MEKNSYLDGKVLKAVKFGNPFDPSTVEGRKRAAKRAAQVRRAKVELEALRAEEQSWSLWGAVFSVFRRGKHAH